MLGAFLLESANGRKVKVGTGFTDKQRTEFWNNRDTYKGKIVEVSAQEISKHSLRFPSFVKMREDKDTPDSI
jgi:ATP-dependent DNA ligase